MKCMNYMSLDMDMWWETQNNIKHKAIEGSIMSYLLPNLGNDESFAKGLIRRNVGAWRKAS